MKQTYTILVCDDDSAVQLATKASLKSAASTKTNLAQFECRSAYNGDEALAILRKQSIDVVLLDIQMRTRDEGLKLIPQIREIDPDISVIMISSMTDFHSVRNAMQLGAVDYVPKDFNPDDLIHTILRVLERRTLKKRSEQQNFEAVTNQRQHVLIGESRPIQAVKKMIEKCRGSFANVVIAGETGTGKEVIARLLRKTLPDGSLEPFVAVDSATIQSSTAESILFGHEKGAFTGAEKVTKGIFEEANDGIVYFDEIANMPLEIQSKLLRVLQEKEISRLGSSKPIKLEFRVICATNRNLEEMVRIGQFKDDLLQRLNVLPLDLPPLRDRRDDIRLLVNHFVSKQPGNQRVLRWTPDAIAVLEAHTWPGNVRELSNVVAYVATMTEGPEVDVADLPPKIRDAAAKSASNMKSDGQGFYQSVRDFEKALLQREYSKLEGNVTKVALALGMDRSHLYTKLKEHGIHPAREPNYRS